MASSVPSRPSYFLGTLSSETLSPAASSPIATETPPAPKSLHFLISFVTSILYRYKAFKIDFPILFFYNYYLKDVKKMRGFNQKKIALINDITGFGRCSIAVSLPIISALKVQCCFIPTAILSNHTGFNNFFFEDYTPKMREYVNNWETLGLNFDGICTGFLGSKEQIKIVIEFLEKFKTKDNIVLIDPVMGDYGKLYSTYTDEMCKEMQNLIKYADVLTPNLTELCRLLDLPYPNETPTHEELYSLCERLSLEGPSKIVITGLQRQGAIENFIFETDKPFKIIKVENLMDLCTIIFSK
mgnify:FL=1